MRQIFANRPVGLLALGIVMLLVVILAILGGRALLGATTEQGAGDTTPDSGREAVTTPARESTESQAPEERTAGNEDQKQESEQAERQAAEEEAQRQAEEQAAADQYAQEWAAVQAGREQAAAEQAAEEQYAAEYDSWRQAAAEREQPIPEQAVGTEGVAPEQPVAPTSSALSLTVPNAGIYNAPVTDSIAESVLAHGAGKLPGTGFPWQAGANTYISGHVYGYEGTGSWQLFAGLPNVGLGSEIYLTDANGTTYTYQVTETLVVAPTDVWVTQPIPGQTTVSLQTCTGPGWSQRMIVRGVLV